MSGQRHGRRRRLGRDGPEVLAIGLGCMSLSGVYGTSDDAAGIALIHRAIDLGVDHFDSSDMYGWGQNEELLGRALAGTARQHRDRHQVRPDAEARRRQRRRRQPGLRAAGLRGEPQAARRRGDRPLLPAPGRSRRAGRGDGRRDGRARRAGQGALSRPVRGAARSGIRRAHAIHPIAAVQSEFSLLYREEATETREPIKRSRHLLRRLRAARPQPAGRRRAPMSPVSPQATLAAAIRASWATTSQKNRALVERVEAIAEEKGCTPAQLSLAWLLGTGTGRDPDPRHQAGRAARGELGRARRAR